jgi:type IV fimbrial biogenesis protein FimT
MLRPRGFSLFDLLFALAVVALLIGIATPAYRTALDRASMAAARATLIESLRASKVHAATRGTRVVLCPSSDGETCTGGTDWSGGWIAFRDGNANRARDPHERLVGAWGALAEGVRITTSAGRPKLVLQSYGGNPGSNVTFVICGRRGPAKAQAVVLSNQGRFSYGRPSAAQVQGRCP